MKNKETHECNSTNTYDCYYNNNNNCNNNHYTYTYTHIQGIAAVERDGYAALQELGGTPVTEVFTAGGGARNEMWTSMRQRMLGVKTR